MIQDIFEDGLKEDPLERAWGVPRTHFRTRAIVALPNLDDKWLSMSYRHLSKSVRGPEGGELFQELTLAGGAQKLDRFVTELLPDVR
jgi:hypothetical protein